MRLKACFPYLVIVCVVMTIYSAFLLHLSKSFQQFQPGPSMSRGDGMADMTGVHGWEGSYGWSNERRSAPCSCTAESQQGLDEGRNVVMRLSSPYRYFDSNHWFHISEYYVRLPKNATVYILAPHELFVANLIPMTFFLLLLAFTDGTARTATVVSTEALLGRLVTSPPERSAAAEASAEGATEDGNVPGSASGSSWSGEGSEEEDGQESSTWVMDREGLECWVYNSSLPAFKRSRRYLPGDSESSGPHRRLGRFDLHQSHFVRRVLSSHGAPGESDLTGIFPTDEVPEAEDVWRLLEGSEVGGVGGTARFLKGGSAEDGEPAEEGLESGQNGDAGRERYSFVFARGVMEGRRYELTESLRLDGEEEEEELGGVKESGLTSHAASIASITVEDDKDNRFAESRSLEKAAAGGGRSEKPSSSRRRCTCARYIGEFGPAPVERGYWFKDETVEGARARIDALCGDLYGRRREGRPVETGARSSERGEGDERGSSVKSADGSRRRLVIYQRDADRRLLDLDNIVWRLRELLGSEWGVYPIVHDNDHEPCWLYSELMDADMLLTPHGFQSMLLLFLPPGATILEVFPYKYWKEGYAPLAKEWGVRHQYIMSRPVTWIQGLTLFFVPLERCMRSLDCRKWSRGADVRLEDHHLDKIAHAARQASRRKKGYLPPSTPTVPGDLSNR